jgi:hypothetical protein
MPRFLQELPSRDVGSSSTNKLVPAVKKQAPGRSRDPADGCGWNETGDELFFSIKTVIYPSIWLVYQSPMLDRLKVIVTLNKLVCSKLS